MDGKFFQAPSPDPEHTTLIATVGTWQAVLDSRPVPYGGAISHVRREGEALSDAEWIQVAGAIQQAIDGKDGAVRVTLPREHAAVMVTE